MTREISAEMSAMKILLGVIRLTLTTDGRNVIFHYVVIYSKSHI